MKYQIKIPAKAKSSPIPMAGGFAGDAVAFLDGDTRAVPRHGLELLSTLPPASLESLACAAASELTTNLTLSSHIQNAAEQQTPSHNEAFAAMCVIVATCARDGGVRTPAEQRYELK